MICLLDTHLILWSTTQPDKLSSSANVLFADPRNQFFFSAASIWELAIKATKRPDIFPVNVMVLRESLLADGFHELDVRSPHALATQRLPLLHHDPFDRILIAQAIVEGLTLATVDEDILRYSAPTLNLS